MVQGWLSVVVIILISTSLASCSGDTRETTSSPLRSDVSLRPDSRVGCLEDEAGPAGLAAPALTDYVNDVLLHRSRNDRSSARPPVEGDRRKERWRRLRPGLRGPA
jgi:hypothetical protein